MTNIAASGVEQLDDTFLQGIAGPSPPCSSPTSDSADSPRHRRRRAGVRIATQVEHDFTRSSSGRQH
jgi:hypothetical protein